jgi:hypothetical protein
MPQVGDEYATDGRLFIVDTIDGNELLLVEHATGEVLLITVLPPSPQQRQRPFQDGWKLRARARTPLEKRPAGLLPHWGSH